MNAFKRSPETIRPRVVKTRAYINIALRFGQFYRCLYLELTSGELIRNRALAKEIRIVF